MNNSISKLIIPKHRKRAMNGSSQTIQQSNNREQNNNTLLPKQDLLQALVDEMEQDKTYSKAPVSRKIINDLIKWGRGSHVPDYYEEARQDKARLIKEISNAKTHIAASANTTKDIYINRNSVDSESAFLPIDSCTQLNEKVSNAKEPTTITTNSTKEAYTINKDSTAVVSADITKIRSFVKPTEQDESIDGGNNKQLAEGIPTREKTTNTKDTMVTATTPLTKVIPIESGKDPKSGTAHVFTSKVTRRVTRQSARLAQQQNNSINDNEINMQPVEKDTSQAPVKRTANKKNIRRKTASKAADKTAESHNSVVVMPTSTISYKKKSSKSVSTDEEASVADNDKMEINIGEDNTVQQQFNDASNVAADDECQRCRKTKQHYEFKKAQIDMEMTSKRQQYELKRASMRTDFVCTLLDKGQNQEQITYWLRACFD